MTLIQGTLDLKERTTNYSFQTSLLPYKENSEGKSKQAGIVFNFIKQRKETTLKELANLSHLDQSTISGRVNDLIDEGKIEYSGIIEYENRKRKRIVLKNL